MKNLAIKAENISKKYRLGEIGTGTLSHDLNRFWHKMRGKEDPYIQIGEANDRRKIGASEYVWALKDINFEIEQGDAVGIIGRNGAGKSTLLKLLSKVTKPTKGNFKIKGRIASLLEIGTGFNPAMTGRENIYLNGAILGMRRKEIKEKFEEIVDFSGVERYIDTPVKRYSSGMYVRLAFAVAAHLESEILLVDEVLSVGDIEFQKKCLGKMDDVSKGEGRTVLFVSHNIGAINQLCSKCIFLNNGIINEIGDADVVISKYLNIIEANKAIVDLEDLTSNRLGNKKVRFQKVWLTKENSEKDERLFSIGEDIAINFQVKFYNPNEKSVKTAIELMTSEGLKIANMIDVDSSFQVKYCGNPVEEYRVVMKDVRLYPGTYCVNLYAGDMSSSEAYDYIQECITFEIIDGGKLTSRRLPKNAGLFFFTPVWNLKRI